MYGVNCMLSCGWGLLVEPVCLSLYNVSRSGKRATQKMLNMCWVTAETLTSLKHMPLQNSLSSLDMLDSALS